MNIFCQYFCITRAIESHQSTYAYQGVIHVSFSENSVYALNRWYLIKQTIKVNAKVAAEDISNIINCRRKCHIPGVILNYKKRIKSSLNRYRDLINHLIENNSLFSSLNLANIIPLLKKTKATDKVNNRSVCIINLLLKLFKKALSLSIRACYEALLLHYFHVHDVID